MLPPESRLGQIITQTEVLPVLHGPLAVIANDIRKGIAGIELNDPTLADSFEFQLQKQVLGTHSRLPHAIQAATLVDGKSFMQLSPEEQRKRIYELSHHESHVGSVMQKALDARYQAFLDSNNSASWKAFVEAYNVSLATSESFPVHNPDGTRGKRFEFRSSVFPVVFDYITVDLPTVCPQALTGRSYNDQQMKLNTRLQAALASSVGVLDEGQTWEDFMNRSDISVVGKDDWKTFYRLQKEHPELIIAMVSGLFSYKPEGKGHFHPDYQGNPNYLTNISTRHDGVKASVQYTRPISRSDKEKGIKELVAEGLSTPRLTLRLPTELVFKTAV